MFVEGKVSILMLQRLLLTTKAGSHYRRSKRDHALNLEETPMKSDCHSVSSVVRIQFEKNVADMSFHSIFTDIQPVSDNFVGAALRNELQDLDLSFGQGLFGSVL